VGGDWRFFVRKRGENADSSNLVYPKTDFATIPRFQENAVAEKGFVS
jgi:hypothetical protein